MSETNTSLSDKFFIGQYHTIPNKPKPIVLGVLSRLIFMCDDLALDFFEYVDGKSETTRQQLIDTLSGKHGRKQVEELIEELTYCGLLYTEDKQPKEPNYSRFKHGQPEHFHPRNLALHISHKCNLGCIYCYGGDGDYGLDKSIMSLDNAKRICDWHIAGLKESGIKKGNITFFGGEPLVNWRIIEPVTEYIKEQTRDTDIKITYGMTTNGTLITEEIAQILKRVGIHPMISIDGGREKQNRQRPFKGGRPSFDAVMKGVGTLMNVYGKRFSARATYIDLDLLETAKELYGLGFRNVYQSFCSGEFGEDLFTDEGLERQIAEHERLYEYYLDNLLKNNDETNNGDVRFPVGKTLMQNLSDLAKRRIRPWVCGAGRSYVGVSPEGNIYMCHRFVGDEQYYMGNAITGEIKEELYQRVLNESNIRSGPCEDCWARMFCSGHCFHHNLIASKTNDAFEQDENLCRLTRALTEISIRVYYKLYNTDPELLKRVLGIQTPVEHEKE